MSLFVDCLRHSLELKSVGNNKHFALCEESKEDKEQVSRTWACVSMKGLILNVFLIRPVIRIDPREQLILKLQHEMNLLKQENKFLRSQLDFPQRDKPRFPHPNSAEEFQKRLQPQGTCVCVCV